MSSFQPPRLLRSPHTQSILASTLPRKLRVMPRARPMLEASEHMVLDCGDGVRLLGELARQPGESRGLVTLIHGWEGSSRSTYMLSAGSALYNAGYDLFRLNLRDHGPSHHLNPELFNSTRLPEVIGAIKAIQNKLPRERQYLAGYSLGGNFALRVAAKAPEHGIHLDRVVGVCPALNPVKTMKALEQGWWLYEKYFVRKWKRSLKRKLDHYPELGYRDDLLKLNSLREMNAFFVPRYTEFPDAETYLMAYAIIGDALSELQVPSHIITSSDDPMIPAEDLAQLAQSENLTVEQTPYGGHCGFVNNFKLDSWVDGRLLQLFDEV